MNQEEIWAAIETQRLDLADLLASLPEKDLERPSLCDGWRVRDVAAHLAVVVTMNVGQAVTALVRARGDINRMISDTAVAHAAQPFEVILEQIRASAIGRVRPPMTKPLDPLFDNIVHGQDVAVPLGIARVIPMDLARSSAEYVWDRGLPSYRPSRRLRGLRFVATDTDWSIGEGEVVEGPMQSLLLILSGRPAALPDLTGAGTAALNARMP
ncbi:maleylpyruvate isomerase family mycothiol-dependent enzyme [Nonomuraea sp. NPDC050556]|uniref:maleylpyruvate isomerase family mycothiol-dependent enzyme n=1 Tax=Nonomuraea sp. NPDC050556 TaxID=3364369 RepID=UPI003787DE74